MELVPINISQMPDEIVENKIFAFLNLKDLFSVRGVNIDWSNLMKNSWTDKIKQEMMENVNSINIAYEKEVLTKTYEFKVKYLLNYKKLFNIYLNNLDIVEIVIKVASALNEEKIKPLYNSFFNFLEFLNPIQMVEEGISLEMLIEFLNENKDIIYEKIIYFMNIESFHNFSMKELQDFKDSFLLLDKVFIDEYNESTKLLYSFLFGMIEFQILKIDVDEVRTNIQKLIEKIKLTTEKWPKRKIFYERAYKLLLYSKQTSPQLKSMIRLFENNHVRHPLVEFSQEALKLIVDLKSKLNNPLDLLNIDLDALVFENIFNRRLILTQKIFILEKFHEIYKSCLKEDGLYIDDEKSQINEFLWCLKFASNFVGDNITVEKLKETKIYLESNFFQELRGEYQNKQQQSEIPIEELNENNKQL